MAPLLTSSLVNPYKIENTSQFKLLKYLNSIRMNEFLIKRSKPVTLYSNTSTFRDSNKPSKLDGPFEKR